MNKKQYKNVYFAGAGGIGMAALVRYYLGKGLRVAGYDRSLKKRVLKSSTMIL